MDISPSKTSAPEKSQSLSPTLEFLDPEETQSEEKEIELKEDNQQTNGSVSPLGTTPLATPSGSPSEEYIHHHHIYLCYMIIFLVLSIFYIFLLFHS